jgi:hypothetical protein
MRFKPSVKGDGVRNEAGKQSSLGAFSRVRPSIQLHARGLFAA